MKLSDLTQALRPSLHQLDPAHWHTHSHTNPSSLFPFSLSAVSCVQLLTLIPNHCCHFCLATASDYSTGVRHKNSLSPFSPPQHMEQTADEKWYERFQEHTSFFLLLLPGATLQPLTLYVLRSVAVLTGSVEKQRCHINSRSVCVSLLCLTWKMPFWKVS